MLPRLASNSQSSYLNIQTTGIMDVCHHTWIKNSCFKKKNTMSFKRTQKNYSMFQHNYLAERWKQFKNPNT
jgi:hypothetical protein